MFAVNEECLMALLIIRQRVVDLFIYFLSLSVMLLEIKDPLTGIYNAML